MLSFASKSDYEIPVIFDQEKIDFVGLVNVASMFFVGRWNTEDFVYSDYCICISPYSSAVSKW